MLPAGWIRVKFGDVVRNVNENSRDFEGDGIDRVVGLDHLDPGSLRLLRWDNLIDRPDGTTFTRKFKPGHVLFGKRRSYQRKVAVPDFHGVCSGDILVFEPADKRILDEFLPCLVQSDGFFDHALSTSAGSLSPRTKWAELAKYEFALPPVEAQLRISGLMQALEKVVTKTRMLATDDVRRAVISEFTHRWRLQFEEVKLADVSDIYQPKTISTADLNDSGEFPVFGANGQIGRYHQFNHAESEVVITCRGATCGTVNLTPPMAWITGNSMVVRPKVPTLLRGYLFAILKFGTDFRSVITGTAQPQITRGSLAPTKLIVPGLADQEALCRNLVNIDNVDLSVLEVRTSVDQAKEALLSEMLAGKYV